MAEVEVSVDEDPLPGDEIQPVYLFGKKVTEIPGLRDASLYGMSAGFGGTMLTYLFTSNFIKSFQRGMNAGIGVFTAYWCYRQWDYTDQARKYLEIEESIKKRTNQDVQFFDSFESLASDTYG